MSAASTLHSTPTFGAGGAEPYARALRDSSSLIYLHEAASDGGSAVSGLEVSRWSADADDIDLTLLGSVTGPLLDVGCGPGRMVRAALRLGIVALGIDVSPAAVEVARRDGLPVLERSVFDALPREGAWQTVLLVDGNIGIGGDVDALLARCAELIGADGEIVVEVHADADRDRRFTARVVDADGLASAEFPWAEVGLRSVAASALGLGLAVRQSWELGGRGFCRLAMSR